MAPKVGVFLSTPLKTGVNNRLFNQSSTAKDKAKSIQGFLRTEIEPYQHVNVDFEEFVREIWGIDKEKIDKILQMAISLDPDTIAAYRAPQPENQLHARFIKISDTLLNAAMEVLGEEKNDEICNASLWEAKGNQYLINGDRKRKPDMLYQWLPVASEGTVPKWNTVKHVIEFKKENTAGETSKRPPAPTDSAAIPLSGLSITSAQTSNPVASSTSTLKRALEGDAQDGGTEAFSQPKPKKKKTKTENQRPDGLMTTKHFQLAQYALEAMAASPRYWVTGVVVDNFKITVCYYDRFLALAAASFFFDEQPAKLALAVYAMNTCSLAMSGNDPHLRSFPSFSDKRISAKMVAASLTRPVPDVAKACLEYPNAVVTGLGDDSETGSNDPTTLCLRIEKVVRLPADLVSRGTGVYRVRRQLRDGKFSKERYAYKLSWPVASRTPEVEFVKHLKEKLPTESHDHLPEIYFSTTLTSEDMGLPWLGLKLDLTENNHQERVLCGIMGKLYKNLWECGSIENFKTVWLDCLEFHHLAYVVGEVLHRDINEENLLVRVPVTKGCPVKGVLNDWDMSKFRANIHDNTTSANHRTGSPTFMALDHLELTVVHRHVLRHDFESYLYILVWALLHYDFEAGTRASAINTAVDAWVLPGTSNGNSKYKFLSSGSGPIEDIKRQIKCEEKLELFNEWVVPLRQLFLRARYMYFEMDDASNRTEERGRTLGGRITFKKVMEAIGRKDKIRTWGVPDFLDMIE